RGLCWSCRGPQAAHRAPGSAEAADCRISLIVSGGRLSDAPPLSLGSILSAVGQGTPPNSLRDLWRTSRQSSRVVSVYDRLCPSLAAGTCQGKAVLLADQGLFVRRWPALVLAPSLPRGSDRFLRV